LIHNPLRRLTMHPIFYLVAFVALIAVILSIDA
jgi:hypothetical protein